MSSEINVIEVVIPMKLFGKALDVLKELSGNAPTTLQRWALRGIRTEVRLRGDHYKCPDCGEIEYDGYMVNKAVWLALLTPDERRQRHMYLHLACLDERAEKYLARRLQIEDFQDLPINAGVRFGFAMGARQGVRSTMCPDCGGNAWGSPPCGSCLGSGVCEEVFDGSTWRRV